MSRKTLAAAALAIAIIAAGCGATRSGSNQTATSASAGSGATSTSTGRAKAVKFSECMRDNGVSAFPDPDASGSLTIDAVANGSSLNTDSAAFKHAVSACKDLEPSGFTGTQRTPQQQQAALQFAQCIRDNGVPDFPDPGPTDPMIDTRRIPSSGTSAGMTVLHAAMQKCRTSAAAAGVSGP